MELLGSISSALVIVLSILFLQYKWSKSSICYLLLSLK